MTTSTSTIKNKEEASHLHDLAKILNNRAAHVIEITGKYEEGISLFTQALELTKQSLLLESSQQDPCSCKFCSLESCFVLSEERKHQHQSSSCSSPCTRMDVVIDDGIDNFIKQEAHATKNKDDNINLSSIEDPMDYCDDLHDNTPSSTTNCPQHHVSTNSRTTTSSHYQEEKAEEDNDGGFVYRRFLLIDDHSITENHYMGSTLSLVIIFNLALTHHLMGIDNDNNNESLALSYPTEFTKKKKSLQHAVKLYEIAYQLYVTYTEPQAVYEHNNTMHDDDEDHNDNNDRAVAVSLRLTMIVSNNLGQIHRIAGNSKKYTKSLQHLLSSIMYMGQQFVPNTVFNSTEFDGLIRNVSPIILHGSICASVA